ncbi:MAG: alpha/beta fold hydrolase [Cyclobacteriaceae bacterium]
MKIHAHIKGSHLHRIAHAGHSACREQPEKLNHLLEQFLGEVNGD